MDNRNNPPPQKAPPARQLVREALVESGEIPIASYDQQSPMEVGMASPLRPVGFSQTQTSVSPIPSPVGTQTFVAQDADVRMEVSVEQNPWGQDPHQSMDGSTIGRADAPSLDNGGPWRVATKKKRRGAALQQPVGNRRHLEAEEMHEAGVGTHDVVTLASSTRTGPPHQEHDIFSPPRDARPQRRPTPMWQPSSQPQLLAEQLAAQREQDEHPAPLYAGAVVINPLTQTCLDDGATYAADRDAPRPGRAAAACCGGIGHELCKDMKKVSGEKTVIGVRIPKVKGVPPENMKSTDTSSTYQNLLYKY
ncbi:hypothetical protein C8T65DRAFT_694320 [Cerioporus squamosus]|nr:hypothetical protein C8T65DRAFT_694320 [Cerioporus squamosus]